MIEIISQIVQLLDTKDIKGAIQWACPVPYFGNLENAQIATLGINPSNREFVDAKGVELTLQNQRFPTLNSLGLKNWMQLDSHKASLIIESCNQYFANNPYDNWFKKLDYIISDTASSYYFPASNACHLDLVPYATMAKWGSLDNETQSLLLNQSRNFLGLILNESQIEYIILNGQSVVSGIQKISNVSFTKKSASNLNLNRDSGNDVPGYTYNGVASQIGDIKLKRPVELIGYNHNIQSSYGISKAIYSELRDWVTKEILVGNETR